MTVFQVPDFSKALRDTLIVAAQEKMQEELHKQKFWQKNSNTISTAFGGIATLVWWMNSQGFDLPEEAQWATGLVFAIATTLGVKATTNGITTKGIAKTVNPAIMDAVAAEAEKLVAEQLEAALRKEPPQEIVSQGDHRSPEVNLDEDIQQMPTAQFYRGRG